MGITSVDLTLDACQDHLNPASDAYIPKLEASVRRGVIGALPSFAPQARVLKAKARREMFNRAMEVDRTLRTQGVDTDEIEPLVDFINKIKD